MIRWNISHARYGNSSIIIEGPGQSHVERNQLRSLLRAAEYGKLAGRDETASKGR